jgi:hypothetical protein
MVALHSCTDAPGEECHLDKISRTHVEIRLNLPRGIDGTAYDIACTMQSRSDWYRKHQYQTFISLLLGIFGFAVFMTSSLANDRG